MMVTGKWETDASGLVEQINLKMVAERCEPSGGGRPSVWCRYLMATGLGDVPSLTRRVSWGIG